MTKKKTDIDLDQTFFALDAEQFAAFMAILDQPPPPNEKLNALFAKKAPWERSDVGGPY
jgi:uncharacterized protein (DUF1778 family)